MERPRALQGSVFHWPISGVSRGFENPGGHSAGTQRQLGSNGALEDQEPPLQWQTAPVAAEPTRGDHAMARDDEWKRVPRHRLPDRAGAAGTAGSTSEFAVGDDVTIRRDRAERPKNGATCAAYEAPVEWDVERPPFSR